MADVPLKDVSKKEYLGDSVYANIEVGHLILTTENGFEPGNIIYLDPEVVNALVNYLRKHGVLA